MTTTLHAAPESSTSDAPFGDVYAGAYDRMYAEKDYAGECAIVEAMCGRHAGLPIRSILDLGCGTGNHAMLMARHGYDVVGVDRSPAMLTAARAKVSDQHCSGSTRFAEGDVRTARLGERFDAAIAMFAVMSYQLTDEDIRAALKTARAHLHDDGLFLFDVWYGPAVLHERPGNRTRMIEHGDRTLVREAGGTLDPQRCQCTVTFRLREYCESVLVNQSEEAHTLRYFFPDELQSLLAEAGFSLLEMKQFPNVDRTPDETSWNVLCVARANAND